MIDYRQVDPRLGSWRDLEALGGLAKYMRSTAVLAAVGLAGVILAGAVDRETALSYATNRTNLELRLSAQGGGDAEPAIPLAPSPDGFAPRSPARPRPSSPRPPATSASEMDDLLER